MKEDKLLDAATTILQEEGVINLNMAQIAVRAGYSRAALYQSWKDKNALLAALCMREIKQNIDLVKDSQQPKGLFSFVLRPLFFNYLKENDQYMLKSAFFEFLELVKLLPDNNTAKGFLAIGSELGLTK